MNITDLNPNEIPLASTLIENVHGKTPLVSYGKIHSDGYNVNLYVKMDTLNPGGSFKDRGSLYFVAKAVGRGKLRRRDTIVTASAGNHAKGVAKAARDYGLNSVIFMSDQTPRTKIQGTKRLEADVRLIDGDYHEAAKQAEEFSREKRITYIPAYEHPDIILGQSTVVTEAIGQAFSENFHPDFIVFPFGGGGLANGGGLAAKYWQDHFLFTKDGSREKTHTYGVQSENFNTMVRSFQSGRIEEYQERGLTIADGIKVPHASESMLQLTRFFIEDMFDVTEEEIRTAIKKVYESEMIARIKQLSPEKLLELGFRSNHIQGLDKLNIIEGAAAAAFACAFSKDKIPYEQLAKEVHPRKEINGIIIASGNNIDQGLLEEIVG